jgi:hypothetical protein
MKGEPKFIDYQLILPQALDPRVHAEGRQTAINPSLN